jgi:hypothetical protein
MQAALAHLIPYQGPVLQHGGQTFAFCRPTTSADSGQEEGRRGTDVSRKREGGLLPLSPPAAGTPQSSLLYLSIALLYRPETSMRAGG